MDKTYLIILVVSLTTIIIRFAPFVLFKNKKSSYIDYLGKVLPYAIMAMLVVYCLKDLSFSFCYETFAQIVAVLSTIIIHKWKGNILLSIVISTIIYMIMLGNI